MPFSAGESKEKVIIRFLRQPSPGLHLWNCFLITEVLTWYNSIVICQLMYPLNLKELQIIHPDWALWWFCLWCIFERLLGCKESRGLNPACSPPVKPPTTAQGFIHPFSWGKRAPFFQIPPSWPRQFALRLCLWGLRLVIHRVQWQASNSSDGSHMKWFPRTFIFPRREESSLSLFNIIPH